MQKSYKPSLGIIGTVGLPAQYGGFETLADHLVKQLSEQYQFTVYCSGATYKKEERKSSYNNAKLVYLPLKANGPQSILYDILSMIHAFFFCDVLLVLGVSGCIFLPLIKFFSNKRVLVNIDGLEWRRPKWSGWTKRFLVWSEWIATRYADEIITDNAAIQKYVLDRYDRYSRLIAYGGDHVSSIELTDTAKEKYNFLKNDYAFKVCRIEPENMLDMVLEAFSKQTQLPLVLVGNWDHSDYGNALRGKFSAFEHLHLIDPIYDQYELNLLRSNCTVYIHGHSAGGTNPSLVEAMYLGLPIFSYGAIYNKITTDKQAVYFDTAAELLALIKNNNPIALNELGKNMLRVAQINYNWRYIADLYAEAAGGKVQIPIPQFDFELPLALRSAF